MKIIATLQGHLKEVYCLLVDKQYQRLLSGSWDLCINVWSLDKLELQRTLKGHQGYISCMCILGDKLFTGSWDRETRVSEMFFEDRQTDCEHGAGKPLSRSGFNFMYFLSPLFILCYTVPL